MRSAGYIAHTNSATRLTPFTSAILFSVGQLEWQSDTNARVHPLLNMDSPVGGGDHVHSRDSSRVNPPRTEGGKASNTGVRNHPGTRTTLRCRIDAREIP